LRVSFSRFRGSFRREERASRAAGAGARAAVGSRTTRRWLPIVRRSGVHDGKRYTPLLELHDEGARFGQSDPVPESTPEHAGGNRIWLLGASWELDTATGEECNCELRDAAGNGGTLVNELVHRLLCETTVHPASVAQPFVAMVALTDRAFGGSGGVGSGGDAAHAVSSKASAMSDRRVMGLDNTLPLLTLSVVCPRP
jgi:hypothetical protein